MLILGEKYTFTKFEKRKLLKKFKRYKYIKYNHTPINNIIMKLSKLIKSNEIIVLNTNTKVNDEIIKYLTNLQFTNNNIQIITIEHFLEIHLHKCYIPDDHTDLHFLEDIKPFSTWQYIQKRLIDYYFVSLLFILCWPIIYFCKYKIKQESRGKLYFKQNRVGKNKKIFQCRKFRTMHEKSYHDPYTRLNDTRIFPWGNTMRKTRIDELPQILNIIRGEMHLIGPRAEWDILVEQYEKEIPYYHERHLVKPGITGWAQVNYPYGANIEDTKQKLMYDLYYIKYWNIILEFKIVWKTILTVIYRKGI